MKLSSFGVLSLSALAAAAPVDPTVQHQRRQGGENDMEHAPDFAPEFGASPFTEFTNCSDDQKKDIERSWEDTKLLLDATKDRGHWGPIEKRYFGDDIAAPLEVNRRTEIHRILNNANGLRFGAHKIPVTCGGPSCTTMAGAVTTGNVGLAWSSNIAFCDQFFKPERKFLEDIMEDHKRLGWTEGKRHLAGKGRITLHELTHVYGISPAAGFMVVSDQKMNGQDVYDFELCEKNALLILDEDGVKDRDVPQPAEQMQRNADSFALYAVEKWFSKTHDNEIPPSAITKDAPDGRDDTDPEPSNGPTKAVTIILENQRVGVAGDAREKMKWLFFSTEFGREVVCKSDPPPVAEIESSEKVINTGQKAIPGGVAVNVKTQDGDCEYKNDGQGNPGALWCSGTAHSCRLHDKWELKSSCFGKLEGEGGADITQKQAIVCEW